MSNDELYEAAMEAIGNLFGDRSVSRRTTITNLNTLIGEIDVMIEALSGEEDDDR